MALDKFQPYQFHQHGIHRCGNIQNGNGGAEVRTLAGYNQIYSDAGPVIDIKF